MLRTVIRKDDRQEEGLKALPVVEVSEITIHVDDDHSSKFLAPNLPACARNVPFRLL